MSKFRWIDGLDEGESLAACLRAVLAAQAVDVSYDELVAALGLGALTAAVPDAPIDLWGCYARDAALVATAERYGLRLRDMHPPDAATGLHSSEEFALHFADSYVPLIGRALEHGQLALAWCGWPPPREHLWGVITAIRDDLIIGYTQEHCGEPLPLVGPALQVYVVEEFIPTPKPDAAALFQHVSALAQAAWCGRWSADAAVLTGSAAYEQLLGVIRSDRNAEPRAIAAAIGQIVAARSALGRWLNSVAMVPSAQRDAATTWADSCDDLVAVLRPYVELESLSAGLGGLAAALERAASLEARRYSDGE